MRPANPQLYARVKKIVNEWYKKPSAYRSMAYIKEYKRRGGKFLQDGRPKNLSRWMREKWRDVNPNRTRKSYPVFRPTRRISGKTPLIATEIPRRVLLAQSRRKQRIRGKHNLAPFGSFFTRRRKRKQ
jgi:Family of unknown function (DUF5872)